MSLVLYYYGLVKTVMKMNAIFIYKFSCWYEVPSTLLELSITCNSMINDRPVWAMSWTPHLCDQISYILISENSLKALCIPP